MLRLFQQADETQTAPSFTASLLDVLSTASGWLNPFRYSRNNVHSMLTSSLALIVATSSSASARGLACFHHPDDDTGDDYGLSCISNSEPARLYKILQQECSTAPPTYAGDCKDQFFKKYFGHGVFGGAPCYLTNNNRASYQMDSCYVDVLDKHVRNEFGTSMDIFATASIAVGGVAFLGSAIAVGVCIFKCARRNSLLAKVKADDLVALLASPDYRFETMSASLKLMDNNEDAQAFQRKLDDFCDNYKCAISLSIMQFPATLPACKHNFEMSEIMNSLSKKNSCPCCRNTNIDSDNIVVNKALKDDINTELAALEKVFADLNESLKKGVVIKIGSSEDNPSQLRL